VIAVALLAAGHVAGSHVASTHGFSGADGALLATVFVLIAGSAVLSLAETGLTRTSRARAKSLEDDRQRGARSLRRLVEDPEAFLAPILLLVLLCQLVAATLVGVIAAQVFGPIGVDADEVSARVVELGESTSSNIFFWQKSIPRFP